MYLLYAGGDCWLAKDIPELRRKLVNLYNLIMLDGAKSYISIDGYRRIFSSRGVRSMARIIQRIDSNIATNQEVSRLCNQFAILRANNKEV